MAISQSTTKLKVVMDRNATNVPVFTFTDQTTYVANGETLSNIKGALAISVNGTVYYNNIANLSTDPDISGASAGQTSGDCTRARTQTLPIQLPTNSDGSVKEGTYLFRYSVTNGTDTITNEISMDVAFTLPVGSIDTFLSLVPTAPIIEGTDDTNYVVQNVTPTITRDFRLYYPTTTSAPYTSTSSTVLEVTTFYTGVQTFVLSSSCVWNYSAKIISSATNNYTSGNFTLYIEDTVEATESVNVNSTTSACDVYCCIKDYMTRYEAASPAKKQTMEGKMPQLAMYVESINLAFQCGNTLMVPTWIDEVKKITECTGDCGCDETPTLITSVSSGGLVLGNTIKFVTSGTTATYYNAQLVNSTYSATNQYFLVFVDGIKDEVTLNSTTGVITFSTPVPNGVTVLIWFAR